MRPMGIFSFSLKDEEALLSCVLFEAKSRLLGVHLEEGMQVNVLGGLSVYARRGTYQLLVDLIVSRGEEGDLFIRLGSL